MKGIYLTKKGFKNIKKIISDLEEKQQILQAQIDVINNLEFNPKKDLIDFILSVNNKIIELQQKLKQLEDE
jgi:hypothetical protein